jgi:tetratricopeptide (TPR) repeat protein
LKLSQLHARKNVVIESKRNLIEFLERMNALGQLDQAFQAVKLFADQFSGSQEIRSMLVELLRATSREDEAREQLEKMAEDLEAMGDKAGARKARERLSTAASETADPHPPTPAAAPSSPRRGDLIFLDTGVDVASPSRPPAAHARPKEPPRPAPEPPRPAKQAPPPPMRESLAPEGLINDESLARDSGMDDLIIYPLLTESTTGESDSLLGLERLGDPLLGSNLDLDAPLEIQRQEPPDLGYEGIQLEGMQGTGYEFSPDLGAGSLDLPDDFGSMPETEMVLDVPAELDTNFDSLQDTDPPDVTGGLPLIQSSELDAPTLADLEERVLDDPENPDVHLDMARGLLAAGEDSRVSEELELALAGYEDREDWVRAAEMADRLVELTPDSVTYHQKRVELAYRAGDRGPLLEAYLGLGDALGKSGALDKAIAVYGRVIEHDPTHVRAAAALARLGVPAAVKAESPPQKPKAQPLSAPKAQSPAPAPTPAAKAPPAPAPSKPAPTPSKPAPAPSPVPSKPAPAAPNPPSAPRRPAAAASGDFVDLGSMVFEEEHRRDTRMRVNRREPEDQDEQREFHEILEQFKRGIEQNLDSEDYEAHYDLGVAFKEMGLLDEAIAEFQKALRAPEGGLRTSEALGMAFFEKGQYAVCESVLKRAVESLSGSDEAKIGLLYWMGRASEALGKQADAIASYERALVVDISFMDLSKRVQKLTGGRRQ